MKKIEKLTIEQEKQVGVYLNKWLSNGYSTEPINKDKSIECVNWLYSFSKKDLPAIWFCNSPLHMQLLISVIKLAKYAKMSYLDTYTELKDKSISELTAMLPSKSIVCESMFSPSLWSYWVGFYDFILNELLPEEKDNHKVFNNECIEFYKTMHMIIPFDSVCFVSERPVLVKTKKTVNESVLHCDTGPALKYKDGYSLYSLNGVIMPEWVLSKPKEELDSEKILKIINAEQRMQAMKHKGMGHFFSQLKTEVIDTYASELIELDDNCDTIKKINKYELLIIDHDGTPCEYLKMINPSTGEIHLEGIKPGITTVKDALAWRNNLTYWINPKSLT